MDLLEREAEIEALDAALATVVRDHVGQVVIVSGDPGIGKSALVSAFTSALDSDVRCWWGRCDDLFVARPLGPVLDIARQAGGRLRERAEQGEPTAVIEAFLDELAVSARPTVVVIDDLQWADMATLDLVRLVARRIAELGALVVLTHRDDIGRDHPLRTTLGGLSGVRPLRLRLQPLSTGAVGRLIGRRAIDPDRLHAVTNGNPFFVVECLESDGDTLPDSVRDAVLARVTGLSAAARTTLDAAAVLGHTMDRDVLAEVVAQIGGDTATVDELIEAHLLEPAPGQWRFPHDLVCRSIEQAMPPEQCRRLHAAAYRALGAGGDVVRRAHHAVGADDRSAVLEIAPVAAAAATRLGAHREAAALYRHALNRREDLDRDAVHDLLQSCAAAEVRADLPADAVSSYYELVEMIDPVGDPLALVSALGQLATALRSAGKTHDAPVMAQRALAVAQASGDRVVIAAAQAQLCHHLMLTGDRDGAVAVGNEAVAGLDLDLDVSSGGVDAVEPPWASSVLNSVGCARVIEGDSSGWDQIRTSLGIAEARGSDADIARARYNQVSVAVDTYALDEAAAFHAAAVDIVGRLDLGLAACLQGMHALQLLRCGRWSAARDEAARLLHDPDVSRLARINPLVVQALLRARLGDPEPGESLAEAIELVAPFTDECLAHAVTAARVEVAWLSGDQTGFEAAARDLARTAVSAHRWYRGEIALWCHRAGIAVPPTDIPEPHRLHLAGRHAEAAAAWTRLGAPYEAADALADSDDPEDLRTAHAQLLALGARARLAMVTRSLRALGVGGLQRGPRATTLANPHALTERELEVLDLLDDGLTNAAIADRLVVSPKTVGHHVSSVLQKLQVANRRHAVRRARELGIVRSGVDAR